MRHFVFGGRFGDICHSLPAVFEYWTRTGERPRFTAAAEFASILDGCAYLEPISAPVPWQNINDIVQYSKSRFPQDEFVVMACYGVNYSPGYKNHSYLRDSWRLSQCPFPPETVPLVFDKRNPAREEVLRQRIGLPERFIAVSTTGKSSPFNHTPTLLADIHTACPTMPIVDIGTIRADRVYDVLGILEWAEVLVTIDTLHLHLSAALPDLPVFALVCDGPALWNRSDWRPQQVWRATYSEYLELRPSFRETLQSYVKNLSRVVA
jgi:hypothetical protein